MLQAKDICLFVYFKMDHLIKYIVENQHKSNVLYRRNRAQAILCCTKKWLLDKGISENLSRFREKSNLPGVLNLKFTETL